MNTATILKFLRYLDRIVANRLAHWITFVSGFTLFGSLFLLTNWNDYVIKHTFNVSGIVQEGDVFTISSRQPVFIKPQKTLLYLNSVTHEEGKLSPSAKLITLNGCNTPLVDFRTMSEGCYTYLNVDDGTKKQEITSTLGNTCTYELKWAKTKDITKSSIVSAELELTQCW